MHRISFGLVVQMATASTALIEPLVRTTRDGSKPVAAATRGLPRRCAFDAAGDGEHQDVERLRNCVEAVVGRDVLDDEHGCAGLRRTSDGGEDRRGVTIAPVVEDLHEEVEVGGGSGSAVRSSAWVRQRSLLIETPSITCGRSNSTPRARGVAARTASSRWPEPPPTSAMVR